MSLIVCSNEVEGDASFNRFSTNQAPYRFTNHLVSPLEIPANSEVAVQSVKCNKDGLVKIDPNMRFYQFFGRDLRNGAYPIAPSVPINKVENSLSWPIECGVKLNNLNMSEYVSMFDLSQRLGEGMRTGIPHADFVKKSGSPLTKCEILRDSGTTGTGFKGFRMTYKYQPASALTATAYPTIWAIRAGHENREHMEVDATGNTITCKKGKAANGTGMSFQETQKNCVWGKEKPISHLGGVLEYDMRGAGEVVNSPVGAGGAFHYTKLNKDFVVGLARAVPNTGPLLIDKNVPAGVNTGQAGGGNDFTIYTQNTWDYAVSSEQIGGNGSRWLKVGHLTQDPSQIVPDLPFAMTDIQYYKGSGAEEWTGSNFQGASFPANAPDEIGRYNMSTNPSHFDTIGFKIENEIISIYFKRLYSLNELDPPTAAATATCPLELLICSYSMKDTAGFKKANCPKPVSQTCWNMYPKVLLAFKDQVVDLDKYNGRDTGHAAASVNTDWYCRELTQGRTRGIYSVDLRYFTDMTNADIYPALGNSGTELTGDAGFKDCSMSVILAPQEKNYTYTEGANMQYILGFIGRGVLDTGLAADDEATQSIVFDSDTTPLIQAKDSMFIRLDNFTQSSFNAGVGRPSKILYHMPRFDTSNREIGAGLYFEPNQRVYTKLGNTNKVTINELDLSICNNREQLLTDLTGETIICLHFREAHMDC
tara:strand:- start:246 stop:2360 length:2115 start_codon:yes stop_codon:yes gene_type:complete